MSGAIAEEPITISLADVLPGRASEASVRGAGQFHLRAHDHRSLRWLCSHPTAPEDFLLSVAHLPECRTELAHRKGPLRLLQLLADVYEEDEAILTLAGELYGSGSEQLDSFQAFLQRHSGNGWMLETLVQRRGSCSEKERALLEAIDNHAERDRLRRVWELGELEREAANADDATRIGELYALNEPTIWRALAGNAHTPAAMLRNLAGVAQTSHASEIRRIAQAALKTR